MRSSIGLRRSGRLSAAGAIDGPTRRALLITECRCCRASLSYAVDPLGKIASNPCEGIKQLYSANRSEIIWTEADIAQLKKTCSAEIAHAVDLAAHTGLRLGDLLRLSWSHVGEDAITITTGKSKHRRTAIIPLYDDLRQRAGAHPQALDHDPDEQSPPPLDS